MDVLLVLVAAAGLAVVVALLRARRPHPWMLRLAPRSDWQRLGEPAPLAPQLLLAPHPVKQPIRCYEAWVHQGGLRVTLGVFESPTGEEAGVFLAGRLMLDPGELASSATQPVSTGTLGGMARTGWIKVTGSDRAEGSWGETVANINWYFPEPRTARVHFASTFIDPEQGQAAAQLVHALLAGATFIPDDGRAVATRVLSDPG